MPERFPTSPRTLALLVGGALTMLPASSAAAQGRAHAHGRAQLNIAIEGTTGVVELVAPAEDVYGFEHAPRTAAQRQRRDAALQLLRTRFEEIVIFEPALGCRLTPAAVIEGREGDGSGGAQGMHAEVRAEFALACRRAPAGREIRFGISRAFPSIRTVEVQLLSDAGQTGRVVTDDRGTVRP